MNLAPFGWTFDSCVFHSFLVATGTTNNRHKAFLVYPFEFGQTQFEINDGLINPYLTPAPGTAIIVLLRRGAKGNIILYICH
jgi:hypothetical protein